MERHRGNATKASSASLIGEEGLKKGTPSEGGKPCGYRQDDLQRTLPTKACGCTWEAIIG